MSSWKLIVSSVFVPLDQDNYKTLFGILDNSFLVAYAIGMFFRFVYLATGRPCYVFVWVSEVYQVIIIACVRSGIFGERLPLRYYLSFGMLMSGLFTCLFGLGFYWKIHSLWYYAFIQVKTWQAQSPALWFPNWFQTLRRPLDLFVPSALWSKPRKVNNEWPLCPQGLIRIFMLQFIFRNQFVPSSLYNKHSVALGSLKSQK